MSFFDEFASSIVRDLTMVLHVVSQIDLTVRLGQQNILFTTVLI